MRDRETSNITEATKERNVSSKEVSKKVEKK